jgi:filamentous hemagglutinin family protein
VSLNCFLHAMRSALAFAFAFGWPSLAPAAGIIASERSATSVATGQNGHEVVSIAPPVGGVSHNIYRQFNVSRAGADLDNTGKGARLIVNEVAGNAPSLIEGPVTVLGPRAGLVIANPNGITVNGARFVNTGNVALSTGAVSLLDFPVGPDDSQRNVVLDTSRGSIVIGPDGLSGAMISLELIAADIRVGGPVVNENTGEGGRLRMVVGASRAEINSAVSPTDNLTPWIAYTGGGVSPGATAIDITPLGSLQAGRIELVVTDQGAGVRHAGQAYASSGAFTLQASGELRVEGGAIAAAGDLALKLGGPVLLSGAQLQAGGDIDLTAAAFRQNGHSLVHASRALRIDVQGDLVNEGGTLIGVRSDGASAAVNLRAGGNVLNASPSPDAPALIYGSEGDVLIQAGGELRNRHARIVANGRLDLLASGDVINEVTKAGGTTQGGDTALRTDYESSDRRWLVLRKRRAGFDIDYGALDMPGQPAYLVAQTGMRIAGANIRLLGGEVMVNEGALEMQADTRILLQAAFTGRAHYERSCMIVCSAEASSTVQANGGLVSASGNVSMKAGVEVVNAGGRVLTLGDLGIAAPRVVARGVPGYTALERDRGLKSWFGDNWAQIYASDIGGSYTALGRLKVSGALVIDGGSAAGAQGTVASDGTVLVRSPRRDPVMLSNHVGLTSWLWQ